MFKLEYFFKSSNFLKMIEMLFTMVIIIGLITTYVYADQWNYTNNPSRFQIDYSYSLNNLSFYVCPWAHSQMPTRLQGNYMPNSISNQVPYDWAPGIQMPWATNNWGKASSFVLAYEPVWAIGATEAIRMGAGYIGQQGQQGYFVDSFFDVFTELSVDGGQNWMATRQYGTQGDGHMGIGSPK